MTSVEYILTHASKCKKRFAGHLHLPYHGKSHLFPVDMENVINCEQSNFTNLTNKTSETRQDLVRTKKNDQKFGKNRIF